jgi:MGT family glycosyltransferase
VARFLFVVPPLDGHVHPTVALGRELVRRGHRVAWTGYPDRLAPLLAPEMELIPLGGDAAGHTAEDLEARSQGLRGVAALEFLWQDFLLPLTTAMLDGVEAAAAAFGPDVLIVDQQAFAGAMVARRHHLPWVTSATTSAELVDPFAMLPKVGEWVRRGLIDLQVELGISRETATQGDLRFSEHLVIAYTTEALAGTPTLPDGSGPVLMVGPSISRSPAEDTRNRTSGFPMSWFDGEGPRVLVTLGTVNAPAGGRFFGVVVEALADSPVRAVVVAPEGVVRNAPANVLVQPFVPQLAVLDHVDAVVSHAGHNTVCESLAKGLPLVVAPIRDDQPIVADQVVRAGAGVRVRFGRVGAAELRAAIDAVLGDQSYRIAASAVQRSFAQAGGAPAAAERLNTLVS